MPQYKLTYFNLTALGEPIRWAFKVAGVAFEDIRIPREEWETNYKFTGRFPTQQVPLLEIDGKVYTQSGAILRHLARTFGLITGNEMVDLTVDQADSIVIDGFREFQKWVREKDPTLKADLHKRMVDTHLPLFLTQIQEIVASSGGDFIGGSKLTYADLSVANWFSIWTNLFDPDLPKKFPRLNQHNQTVLAIPEIKAWIEVRPKTNV
ncbi:unnamed protein product [Allacma fusca]|uniref:Glutathione S-transferase n=1 Tax=Allacma fusca TaxID=39272 RepID=A0A8J2PBV3_9HEXA|nr:unnamed protein product [Allacma fusca]